MADHSHPLIELTRGRLLELVREPAIVFWVFGFPILLSIGLGIAFRERAPEVPVIAVVGAPALAASLDASAELDAQALEAAAAAEALRKNRVDVVLTLASETATAVRYRFDPARAESRQARLVADTALQRLRGRADVVSAADVAVTERGSRYIDFLLPGLLGLNLMGSSMWGIGFAVVDARSRKLMKRFAATPLPRAYYLLSFILARFVLLVVELAVLVAFGALAFDVVVQGSLAALVGVSVLGALAFAGVALLVAARPRTVEVASGWMNFVMMPMWLLSGAFFSYERFPEPLVPIIRALPLTALIDALRAITNEGATLWAVGPQVLTLVVWMVLGFVISLRIFRWQ
jgi:ABC-2 type transport system permease protein